MKKWLVISGVLLVPVIGATLALPSLVPAESLKEQALAAVASVTGAELQVIGPASVSLWPTPRVTLSDVRLRNPRGFSDIDMLAMDRLEAAIGWGDLFADRPSPSRIVLARPVLVLERLSNGAANWENMVQRAEQAQRSASSQAGGFQGEIAVEGGEIQFKSPAPGEACVWKNLALTARPASGLGVEARWKWHEEDVSLTAQLPSLNRHEAQPVNLSLSMASATLSLEGQAAAGEGIAEGSAGALRLEVKDAARLLRFREGKAFTSAAPTAVALEGKWRREAQSWLLHDAVFTAPGSQVSGALRAQPAASGALTMQLGMRGGRLDLDPLIAAWSETSAQEGAAAPTPFTLPATLSETLNVAFQFESPEVTLNGAPMKQVSVSANLSGGEMVVNQASATLPGESSTRLFGVVGPGTQGLKMEGRVEVKSASLRTLAAWAGTPLLNDMPASVMGPFQLGANALLTGNEIRLSEIKAQLDQTSLAGAALITLAEPRPVIDATLRFDSLDGDAYFPPAQAAPASPQGSTPPSTAFNWLHSVKAMLRLNLSGRDLSWRGKEFTQPAGYVELSPGELKFSRLALASSWLTITGDGGVKLGGERPYVTANLNLPSFDTALLRDAPDTPEMAAKNYWSKETFDLTLLRQYDGSFSAQIGAFTHRGFRFAPMKASARLDAGVFTVDQLRAGFADGTLDGKGSLTASALPRLAFSFSLTGAEIQKTLLAFGGENDIVGRMNMTGSYATSGNDAYTMARNLEGSGSVAAGNVSVGGLDLVSLARRVTNIRTVADLVNLTRLAIADGRTLLQQVTGNIVVKSGIAETPGMTLAADVASGMAHGRLNFYEMTIDALVQLSVRLTGGQTLPPLGLLLKGDLLAPSKQLDTKALEEYIAKRSAERMLRQNETTNP